MVADNRFTINYFVPLTDLLGRVKGDQLERKIEDYECAEAEFIHKTWQNIRSKLVKRAVNKDLQEQKIAKPTASTPKLAKRDPMHLV